MSSFITSSSTIKQYMVFPRYLMDASINETAMIIYMVLLDRTRMSRKKDEWTDSSGRVFVHYPISKLAENVHKSETTVKTALADLERADLILRQHQGIGKPNRIYVKIPADCKLTASETENCPPPSQNSVCHEDSNLSGSKNDIVKTISKKEESKSERHAYGLHNNVFLTKKEYEEMLQKLRNPHDCINRLSDYMHRRGVNYSDHAATLILWAKQDGNYIEPRNYDCEEGASL